MCQTRPTLLRSRALWLHFMLDTVSDDEHFDMQTFVQRRHGAGSPNYASYIGVTAQWPWCNTASCIGGTIVMLGFTAEERADPKYRDHGFGRIAAEWLGLGDSSEARDLTGTMFSPGPFLHQITRQNAIAAMKKLYEDGVWWWRNVPGMREDFFYARNEVKGDRGDAIPVDWSTEPDVVVGNLFALRDRVRKAYWNGKNGQPFGATRDNDVEVCLLTGIGAISRSNYYSLMDGETLRNALRRAVPPGTTFVHVSDSGLVNALALIDKAILIRLGVLPALREIG